jgi:hypothetical protein
MQEANDESDRGPTIYRPDHELVSRLLESIHQRRANLNLKLEMTDLNGGHVQTIFVQWEGGDLDTLATRIQNALNMDPMADRYEDYFWLFWRGWAGCLNADLLVGLPAVTPDLLDKVQQNTPLRGSDLSRLRAALEWAFANAAAEWGATDSWEEGTISPGHFSMRRKVGDFIGNRMAQLHGPDYENAPTNT